MIAAEMTSVNPPVNCPHCGGRLAVDDAFCPECGAKFPRAESILTPKNESGPQLPQKPANSRTQLVVAVIAILLLFSLFFIYVLANHHLKEAKQQNYYTYNGYSFTKQGSLWITQAQAKEKLYTLALHYGPREVEDIMIAGNLSKRFIDADFAYISVDPEYAALPPNLTNETHSAVDEYADAPIPTITLPKETDRTMMGLSVAELAIIMQRAIGRKPIAACTRNETEACSHRPIMPCKPRGRGPVIYMNSAGKAALTANGDCFEISGEGTELLRATDRLILYWLGIMRPEKPLPTTPTATPAQTKIV